jgi:hypothetical protein
MDRPTLGIFEAFALAPEEIAGRHDGDICRVLVYGEKYVSLWAYFPIEPAYPKYGR